MVSNVNHFCVHIILICCSHFVNAVPPEYCLQTLNTSDCKGPPTPVFYYYKPGSRCELGIWRGCPTNNKFDDQYLCSHYCIFRFIKEVDEPEDLIDYTDQCSKTVKENTCKDNKHNVAYTFSDEHQECLPIVWGDCKSPNIFKEKQVCIDTCVINWQDEIKNLTENEVKEIDELLDNVTSNSTNDTTEGHKPLKLKDDDVTPSETANITESSVSEAHNSTGVPETSESEKPASEKTTTEKAKTETAKTEKAKTEEANTEKANTAKATTAEATTAIYKRETVKDVILPDDD